MKSPCSRHTSSQRYNAINILINNAYYCFFWLIKMQFEAFMVVSTRDAKQPKGMHMKNEPLPTTNEEWGFWGTSKQNGYDAE